MLKYLDGELHQLLWLCPIQDISLNTFVQRIHTQFTPCNTASSKKDPRFYCLHLLERGGVGLFFGLETPFQHIFCFVFLCDFVVWVRHWYWQSSFDSLQISINNFDVVSITNPEAWMFLALELQFCTINLHVVSLFDIHNFLF